MDNHVFRWTIVFVSKKKAPGGAAPAEDRARDAPKPPLPTKSIQNQQKSKNNTPSTMQIIHYSWVWCQNVSLFVLWVKFPIYASSSVLPPGKI